MDDAAYLFGVLLMVTLLRVPDLVAAVEPLLGRPISTRDIFGLIAAGGIRPFGYVLRAPVFTPEQIADVAESLRTPGAVHLIGGSS